MRFDVSKHLRHACEICGDNVQRNEKATTCGHTIRLCETCKRDCPGALRLCVSCEDRGINPDRKEVR